VLLHSKNPWQTAACDRLWDESDKQNEALARKEDSAGHAKKGQHRRSLRDARKKKHQTVGE
jgi:hypothetical protein